MKTIKTIVALAGRAIVMESAERSADHPSPSRFTITRKRWYALTPASFRRLVVLTENPGVVYQTQPPYSRAHSITREREI